MRIKLAYPLTLGAIAEYTNAEIFLNQDKIINFITTDTRELEAGDLFVALKGESFDGNDYAPKAIELGAIGALCDRVAPGADDSKMLICSDTVAALGALAKQYLSLHRKKVVAITGSVGKTTTKEFVYSVLSQKFKVHKTAGNLNNELGLPYTVLSMPQDAQILVTEMGMSGLGEIEYLSEIAKPDIALVTIIGSSHLEHLGTRENICKAKMEIVKGMNKEGVLLVNGDEPLLRSQSYSKYNPRFLSLSNSSEPSEYKVSNITTEKEFTLFDFSYNKDTFKLKASGIGRHIAQAGAFASAVGLMLGMEREEIEKGLMSYKTEKMRQNIYKIGEITIIDDCYNASPESMRAASDVLFDIAKRENSRAVALLGDMKELGENTRVLHEGVGEYLAKNGLALLFTFGLIAENYAIGAKKGGMDTSDIFSNPNVTAPEISGDALVKHLRAGDVLLIKASRAMSAEKIINYLSEHIN